MGLRAAQEASMLITTLGNQWLDESPDSHNTTPTIIYWPNTQLRPGNLSRFCQHKEHNWKIYAFVRHSIRTHNCNKGGVRQWPWVPILSSKIALTMTAWALPQSWSIMFFRVLLILLVFMTTTSKYFKRNCGQQISFHWSSTRQPSFKYQSWSELWQ